MDKSRLAAVVACVLSLIAACVLALAAQPAHAASLVRVTDFGIGPTNLNMYVYTPGLDISSPALLVLVHPCGGSANGILGGNGHSGDSTLPDGQTITSGWSATYYSPINGQVTARNADYNAQIPPGGSVSIGFQATHTGDSAAAGGFALNNAHCTGA